MRTRTGLRRGLFTKRAPVDCVRSETTPPNRTCLFHPNPLESVAPKMATPSAEARYKVLGENVHKLYGL